MLDTCNSISQRQTENKLIRVKIFLTLQVQNPMSIDKSLTKQAKRGQLAEGRLMRQLNDRVNVEHLRDRSEAFNP